ncbi:MAG: zf-HC2 domain-containing protein [Bryobacteraceae bacterium]|nr:zf-HC2 domain-containing protein [Bryobacteraceae bacterium]
MNRTGKHEEIHPMLSAYFDEELTQADSQRVHLHVEECEECRSALREMYEIQQLTSEMKFRQPPEAIMEALETRISVQAPRKMGWTLVIAGLAGWLLYALAYAWKHLRWPTMVELLVEGTVAGLALVFISVLRQRLLERPHDRYRKVRK